MLANIQSSQQQRSAVQSTKAIIEITNLRLRTFIGFNPEEREKQQDIIINAEIHYQLSPLCLEDQVDQALNYKTIAKSIIKLVEEGRFLLLEKLVAEVLDICSRDESVFYAKVKIDKPHALRFADSVSLTLEYGNK
ncbi:dihydroneopterin triphosphate 2'-epimerase [Teredinibacter sp. KSP-S5-2]|uniref:dihydroneopterin triphosphate 2'-epimerase n=1 Tax=Teredinibacter sp. KSP-S5-2 TaxID=3034506 RepID=UPI002934AF82|nr:dihydroneopterin triphosphate 2'-epimerase [Teredinibacter sp. KSP-S5-2]WNO08354.1 dihydroneopterin triphosphate 2'-epimerase [Teredinibacter sp. KSP-S5-2]